jgi:hypothetical protein
MLQKQTWDMRWHIPPEEYKTREIEMMKQINKEMNEQDSKNIHLTSELRLQRANFRHEQELEFLKLLDTCPRFETLSNWSVMNRFYDRFIELTKNYWQKNPNKIMPEFGTLPTGNVNAKAIGVPNNQQHIVAFEDEVFTFCLLICKVIGMALPKVSDKITSNLDDYSFSTDISKVEETLNHEKELVFRFQDMVLSYVILGSPSQAERYNLDFPYDRGSNNLRNSMEAFMLGHELGHVIRNHLAEKKVPAGFISPYDLEQILYSHEKEFEADIAGLILSSQYMKKFHDLDIKSSYRGIELFFGSIDVIDRSIITLRTGRSLISEDETKIESHPKPRDRLLALRELTRKQYTEQVIAPTLLIDKIMQVLWNKTERILIEKHRNGERHHKKFDQRFQSI